jgi:methylated-DNA-[protein]-cysteine S-methyltransferase
MTQSTASTVFTSPYGPLQLHSNGTALTRILLPSQIAATDSTAEHHLDDVLQEACREFQAYFDGQLTEFAIPLEPETGTMFQREVWAALRQIPVGTTISYSTLATQVGRPKAVRAVGAANGRNPLPIIVPCHRVIGADGSLTGYAGGVQLKQQLLSHENQWR